MMQQGRLSPWAATHDRRLRILRAIRDHCAREQRPPTIRELRAAAQISSTGSLTYTLAVLERQGLITKLPGTRGLFLTPRGAQIVEESPCVP